ncbi:MAG TPA: pyruvate kinase [Rhizomicrobium sp.]|jgi:pyruvate kinase
MASRDIGPILKSLRGITTDVEQEADRLMKAWRPHIDRDAFRPSAQNLARYVALRHHDLRPLQRKLARFGLSSLGRLESRVAPTLAAVTASLAVLGEVARKERHPPASAFFAGERRLAAEARAIFGPVDHEANVALLVTCPAVAAADPDFMMELAKRRIEAVRINCAHDDADTWARMVAHLRAACASTGHSIKVFMDLAGPKIRTGKVQSHKHEKAHKGDLLVMTAVGGFGAIKCDKHHIAVECTLAEVLLAATPGDRVFVDDGKLGAEIEARKPWGLVARVTLAKETGVHLKSEKALNFPDTALDIPALTDADREALPFVAEHADGIEFSFVQSADDVRQLQEALCELRPDNWREKILVLKIETAQGVVNLPDILVQAAGRQPTAIMIARGDLSVEIGFARTAEVQEELLWLAEAASVPSIWATQVLEKLVKSGTPSRGEMTDAAMAARAECVMLNKGPHLLEAIDQLRLLFGRMEDHQHKKFAKLRRLHSW